MSDFMARCRNTGNEPCEYHDQIHTEREGGQMVTSPSIGDAKTGQTLYKYDREIKIHLNRYLHFTSRSGLLQGYIVTIDG